MNKRISTLTVKHSNAWTVTYNRGDSIHSIEETPEYFRIQPARQGTSSLTMFPDPEIIRKRDLISWSVEEE